MSIYNPRNYFKDGGRLDGLYSTIGSVGGSLASDLIGGGYQTNSTVSGLFDSASKMASAIPGPWGAIAGAGIGTLGGVTNALFGTKTDQQALDDARQGTNYLNNFTSNASSFDDITMADNQGAVRDAYKGGWFSSASARRKNEKLRQQREAAQARADASVYNNIGNIDTDMYNSAMQNYYAKGGLLSYNGADFDNGLTYIDAGGRHGDNPYGGVPMGADENGVPNLVEQGETVFNDYVFSDRMKVPKAFKEANGLKGKGLLTYSDAAKKYAKETEERPNDPISQRGMSVALSRLAQSQENERMKDQIRKQAKAAINAVDNGEIPEAEYAEEPAEGYACGGLLPIGYSSWKGNTFDDGGQVYTPRPSIIQNFRDRANKAVNDAVHEYLPEPVANGLDVVADVSKAILLPDSENGSMEMIGGLGSAIGKIARGGRILKNVSKAGIGYSGAGIAKGAEKAASKISNGAGKVAGKIKEGAKGFSQDFKDEMNKTKKHHVGDYYSVGRGVPRTSKPQAPATGQGAPANPSSTAQTPKPKHRVRKVVGGIIGLGAAGAGGAALYKHIRNKADEKNYEDEMYNDVLKNINEYADGGQIHIAKNKRGTFTAAATKHGMGVQEFASHVLSNPDDYSPAMRKKANFARNAAHWHAYGGLLNTGLYGGNDFIDNDPNGSYQGVIRHKFAEGGDTGGDDEGSTPLARIVPQGYENIANNVWGAAEFIPGVGNILGVADVANDIYNMANSKHVGWNDVANFGLDVAGLIPGAGTLAKGAKLAKKVKAANGAQKLANASRKLSFTSPSGVKEVKKGVQKAISWNNKATEEARKGHLRKSLGATEFTNGVLNDVGSLLDPKYVRYNNFRLRGSTADAVNDAFNLAGTQNQKAYGGPLGNYFAGKGKKPNTITAPSLVYRKLTPQLPLQDNSYKVQGSIPMNEDWYIEPYRSILHPQETTHTGSPSSLTRLRYVPAFGAAVSSITDALGITNRPDYAPARAIGSAARRYGDYVPVTFNPIGNYTGYTPLDRLFYSNRLENQSAGNARNIINTGATRGAAVAGLLANDYNANNRLGELYRAGDEYNAKQRLAADTFNRETDKYNSEGDLRAQMANQEARQRQQSFGFTGLLEAQKLRQNALDRASTARSANLTNLFNSLGEIGREAYMRNTILTSPWTKWYVDNNGKMKYKVEQ